MFLKKSTVKGSDYYNIVSYYRENGKRHIRIVQKLGKLTDDEAEEVREWLKSIPGNGKRFISFNPDDFKKEKTYLHGQIGLMHYLWEELKIDSILLESFTRYKNKQSLAKLSRILVLGRYDDPSSDRDLAEKYDSWSLGFLNGVPDIYEQELYRALTRLYEQKDRIELELWRRIGSHLTPSDPCPFFKDITSSYFEGKGCGKAAYGYSRDHRPDCKQINWGLVITEEGIPITLEIYPGNQPDKTTVLKTCKRLRDTFHISSGIFVGDRGMVTEENIHGIEEMGYHYILTETVRNVQEIVQETMANTPQPLGDEILLGEVEKGKRRWVVMKNPEMAEQSRKDRDSRIQVGQGIIEKVRKAIASGRLKDRDKIVKRVMKNLLKKNLDKYFDINQITYEKGLSCPLKKDIDQWDGIWVITTDLDWGAKKLVETYRELWKIESAFNEIKNVIDVRPIGHRRDDHVEAHIFVCVLGYYLERYVEIAVRANGLDLTGKTALEAFKLVTLDQISMGSKTVWRITELTDLQRSILKALGISERKYREIEQRPF